MRQMDGCRERINPLRIGERPQGNGSADQTNGTMKERDLTRKDGQARALLVSCGMAELTADLITNPQQKALDRRTAFEDCTNIRKALRLAPDMVRGWLIAQIGSLCRFVDATKTISTEEELVETARALIEEFPAFTLSEFHACFDAIKRDKFGPMYGRLKLGELMQCCRKWEEDRAEQVLERRHRPDFDPHPRSSTQEIKPEFIGLTLDQLKIIEDAQQRNKEKHPENPDQ